MTPKKVALFAIGPLGAALLGLITLPIITWFFSQEDVGRMAMLQVAISFSTLLFSLGLDQSYVREFHEDENKPALLKRAILPGLLLLSISLVVLLVEGEKLSEWLFEVSKWHLSALVALALLGNFVSRFLSLVLRMNERGLAFSMSQLLPKFLLLAIVCGYVVFDAQKDLTNLVIANTVAVTFVSVAFAWNTRAEWLAGLRIKIDMIKLKRMLRFGLPLVLGGLAFWGLTAIDKVFLRTLSSYEELAVYSVAVSLAAAGTILQSVFSTVWAPTVYKWASTGEGLENVHRVRRFVLALVIIGFSLAGLFSWVIPIFLPAEYSGVQWLVISSLGYPLFYTLSETTVVGIGISRRSSLAMLAAIVAFVVNLAGNWLLIPLYGAAGAAASTCFSFWLFFILRTELSIYVWQKISRLILYTYSTILVFGASAFTIWGEHLHTFIFIFWGLVLVSLLFTFKPELNEVKKIALKSITS